MLYPQANFYGYTKKVRAKLLTWETVPIKEHICTKIKRKEIHCPFLRVEWSLVVKTWIHFTPWCFETIKLGWHWSSASGQEDQNVKCFPLLIKCIIFGQTKNDYFKFYRENLSSKFQCNYVPF